MVLLLSGCGGLPQPLPEGAAVGSTSLVGTDDGASSSSSPGTSGSSGQRATSPAEPEPSTGSSGAASSTANDAVHLDVGAPKPVDFVDVTEAAGLASANGPAGVAPDCMFDNPVNDTPGDFCWPERFTGAAAVGDVDGDGWLDLFVTRRAGGDRLLRNAGDGTFEDVTPAAMQGGTGISGAVAWFDADGDGDLDLYRTRIGAYAHELWIQAEDGSFSEQAGERGADVASNVPLVGLGIAVGDYDLDGVLDLFVAEWRPDKEIGGSADHNRLLHGLGDGTFEDVTATLPLDLRALAPVVDAKAGVYGFAPAFVDLDGDRWPELTLTADFGTSRLLWNEGGTFVDTTWDSGVGTERNGMGSAFGDFDADGDLDWFVSAIWADEFPSLGHRLYRNDGNRLFVDVAVDHGLHDAGWGWGAAWWDPRLDGNLDLVMAAGWPTLGYAFDPLVAWSNDGEGPWGEHAMAMGLDVVGDGRGLVPFDMDRDGDEDLLVLGNVEGPRLFRNDAATGQGLTVRAVGTSSNVQGIGAQVRVRRIADDAWRSRWIFGDSALMGQRPAEAVVGLGARPGPVDVEVWFPSSDQRVLVSDVEPGVVLEVVEPLNPPA